MKLSIFCRVNACYFVMPDFLSVGIFITFVFLHFVIEISVGFLLVLNKKN
jgi:hypothetical protein